jgi:hypothetical protein
MNPMLSNEMRLEPFPWYSTMRQTHPVAYDPRQYSWSVFRYDVEGTTGDEQARS